MAGNSGNDHKEISTLKLKSEKSYAENERGYEMFTVKK